MCWPTAVLRNCKTTQKLWSLAVSPHPDPHLEMLLGASLLESVTLVYMRAGCDPRY